MKHKKFSDFREGTGRPTESMDNGQWTMDNGQWTISRIQENVKDKYCDNLKVFCYVKQLISMATAMTVLERNIL